MIFNMVTRMTLVAAVCFLASGGKAVEAAGAAPKPGEGGAGIKWLQSLDKGRKIAGEQGKPLMVDFYSTRCRWCDVFDKETFTDPKVRELAERFVPVKVNAGKAPEATRKYRIKGLPTVLFLDSEGKVIHTVIGYRAPEPFLSEMKKALSSSSR